MMFLTKVKKGSCHMKKKLFASVGLILGFVVWTVLVRFVDVQAIGPWGSSVGFATVNGWFHSLTGVHMWLYTLTDWLGLVPIAFCLGFAILGLAQWIKRKHFLKVDYSILVLGGFYIVVMAVYVLFEYVVINRRPVLIEGYLQASYPSSTTMLVMCVMPPAIMQLHDRIQNALLRKCVAVAIGTFTVFMVIGRLVSGVHWLTDIIGGALISAGLVMGYSFASRLKHQ
jgi:undecaprenyl-diphosphatase